jgi:hypothetical protein
MLDADDGKAAPQWLASNHPELEADGENPYSVFGESQPRMVEVAFSCLVRGLKCQSVEFLKITLEDGRFNQDSEITLGLSQDLFGHDLARKEAAAWRFQSIAMPLSGVGGAALEMAVRFVDGPG